MHGTSTSSVGSTMTANAPGRLSQVQEQVQRGAKITERLEAKLKSLYERLQPVLAQTGSDANSAGNPKPTLVGHANALSNHNDQLELLDSGMAEILDRLEL
jgi:hypothetical protein